MRRLFFAALLLLLSSARTAWADSQTAQSNQIVQVYRNVSGSTLASGTGVQLDFNDTDRSFACGFKGCFVDAGHFVETTTTADDDDFVGVLLADSCLDDQECPVVIWGPALVRWAGSTDNTNTVGALVGTTTVDGQMGSGTGAGTLLSLTMTAAGAEVNGSADGETRWVFVAPDLN
mgnify:CR=1 FL=1